MSSDSQESREIKQKWTEETGKKADFSPTCPKLH